MSTTNQRKKRSRTEGTSLATQDASSADTNLTKPRKVKVKAQSHARAQSSSSQSQQHKQPYTYRNMEHNLHTPLPTLKCAKDKFCIPCSYKIATFDIALDSSFTKSVPNTRPELCPRSSTTLGADADVACGEDSYSYGYCRGMKVLTIGDGDFSFSLALARILCSTSSTSSRKNSSQRNVNLVATSYESFETLQKVYPQIQNTIDELIQLNVKICYEVDATNLQTTLPIGISSDFHRIVWNFPCTAIANGQDGQNQQMHENQMLVRRFVKQCVGYLHPSMGEIHFLHKTKPPYDQWGLESVAVANNNSKEAEVKVKVEQVHGQQLWSEDAPCPFEYKGRVVFDKCLLPPYTPRKALDKKSFPCHDACLFVFGWKHDDDDDGNEEEDVSCFPATIPTRTGTGTGTRTQASKENNGIIPVTEDLIDEIRSIHLSLGSHKDRKKRKLKHTHTRTA